MSDPLKRVDLTKMMKSQDVLTFGVSAIVGQNGRENVTFESFPKIPRLNREIIITEKIDGTNAAIGVTPEGNVYAQSRNRILAPNVKGQPQTDNYGFAAWVQQNAGILRSLDAGLHFGEWWGSGIGRGYGLSEKRFSLFNVGRWVDEEEGRLVIAHIQSRLPQFGVVPVLYRGPWTNVLGYTDPETSKWLDLSQDNWDLADKTNPRPRYAPTFIVEWLKRVGSQAVDGYDKPEGIVVFHKASGSLFKVTVEKDEEFKGNNRVKEEV